MLIVLTLRIAFSARLTCPKCFHLHVCSRHVKEVNVHQHHHSTAQPHLAVAKFHRSHLSPDATTSATVARMSQRPGEKVVHQDYIARIRYSNALPPPPNPPKLLDIPGTGLAGGQYTSAGYASRLARDQPLNIEADAELGMPIDLIGIPGIFDGDERGESHARLW